MRFTPPETLKAEGLVPVHPVTGDVLKGYGVRIAYSDSRIGAWWTWDREQSGRVMWAQVVVAGLYAVLESPNLHKTHLSRAMAIAARDEQWSMAAESVYHIGGHSALASYIETYIEGGERVINK